MYLQLLYTNRDSVSDAPTDSVIVASADHLLTCGSQQNGVFILCGVATLDITQRRIGVYDTGVTQVLECHQVLAFTETIQPASTERQCSEMFIYYVQ